jgi:hypothetical protein
MQTSENRAALLAAQSKYKNLSNQQIAVKNKQAQAASDLEELRGELVALEKLHATLEKKQIREDVAKFKEKHGV